MKTNKMSQYVFILVFAVFITFGTMLVIRLTDLRQGNEFYEQIKEEENQRHTTLVDSALPMTSAEVEDSKYQSASGKGHDLSQRLSRFAEEYPDTAIWLQLPGTSLDYPVMLGADNQFYLNHLPDRSKNALGSLFLDCRTSKDSVHLIVYGHNGFDGKMFGILKQFESEDYFREHRTLTIATPDSVYECPVFSVRWVDADSDAYRLEFDDGDSLADYINRAAAESLYQTDVDFEEATRVVTLSTCTGRHNQRFIVQACLLTVKVPDAAGPGHQLCWRPEKFIVRTVQPAAGKGRLPYSRYPAQAR